MTLAKVPPTSRNVKGVLFADYVRMIRGKKDVDWSIQLEHIDRDGWVGGGEWDDEPAEPPLDERYRGIPADKRPPSLLLVAAVGAYPASQRQRDRWLAVGSSHLVHSRSSAYGSFKPAVSATITLAHLYKCRDQLSTCSSHQWTTASGTHAPGRSEDTHHAPAPADRGREV